MLTRTFSLYRTSFSGLSRETWLLSLVMLINRSGTMVLPFMTLYLTTKEMGRSLSEAGTVIGLFGLGSVIGAYFGGKVTDRSGFYRVQLFTLLAGGAMFIVLGQVKSYPLICALTFVLSLVNEAFRPANSAAIAHYSSEANRTRSYSLNRLAINLGWAAGTSIGGIIASYDYELLFWVDGITNISAALVMAIFLKPAAATKTIKAKSYDSPARSAYSDRTYLWFIFLIMLFAMSFFQLFTTLPKYFRDNLFLGERFIGMLMAVNGLLIVATEMVLVYKLEGKRNNLVYISAGVFVCALAFLALLLPGDGRAIALLMIFLITVGEIVGMPFMNSYWSMRSDERNRGQYAALYTISWGLAQTLGPVLCAILVDLTNFRVMFVVLGAVLMLASYGFYRMRLAEAQSRAL
jgi:predicted MFS family arabinose efflux permease